MLNSQLEIVISIFLIQTVALESNAQFLPTAYQEQVGLGAKFPHSVTVVLQGSGGGRRQCRGSLVAPRWVLTAAHCINEVHSVKILMGSNRQREGLQATSDDFYFHSRYDPKKMDYDAALVELRTPVPITEYTSPIHIEKFDLNEGQEVMVTGWGAALKGGAYTNSQNALNLKIISEKTCEKLIGQQVSDSFMCLEGLGSSVGNSCKGDEGAAVVMKDEDGLQQVGVLSSCTSGVLLVLQASHLLSWIQGVTGITGAFFTDRHFFNTGKKFFTTQETVYTGHPVLPGYSSAKHIITTETIYNSGKPAFNLKPGKPIYNSGKYVSGGDRIMDTGYNTGKIGFSNGQSSYTTSKNVVYNYGKPAFSIRPAKTIFPDKVVFGMDGTEYTDYKTGKNMSNRDKNVITIHKTIYNSDNNRYKPKIKVISDMNYPVNEIGNSVYGISNNMFNKNTIVASETKGDTGIDRDNDYYADSDSAEFNTEGNSGYNTGKNIMQKTVGGTGNNGATEVFDSGTIVYDTDNFDYNNDGQKTFLTSGKTDNTESIDFHTAKTIYSTDNIDFDSVNSDNFVNTGKKFSKTKTLFSGGNTGDISNADSFGYNFGKTAIDAGRTGFDLENNGMSVFNNGRRISTKKTIFSKKKIGEIGETNKIGYNSGKTAYSTVYSSGNASDSEHSANSGVSTGRRNYAMKTESGGNTGDIDDADSFGYTTGTAFNGISSGNTGDAVDFDYNMGKSVIKTIYPSGNAGDGFENSSKFEVYAMKNASSDVNTSDIGNSDSFSYNFGKTAIDTGRTRHSAGSTGLDLENTGEKVSAKKNIFASGNTDKIEYNTRKTALNSILSFTNTGDDSKNSGDFDNTRGKIYSVKPAISGGNNNEIGDADSFDTHTGKTEFNSDQSIYSTGNNNIDSETPGIFGFNIGKKGSTKKITVTIENSDKTGGYNTRKAASNTIYLSGNTGDSKNGDHSDISTGGKIYTLKTALSGENTGGIGDAHSFIYNNSKTVIENGRAGHSTGKDAKNSDNLYTVVSGGNTDAIDNFGHQFGKTAFDSGSNGFTPGNTAKDVDNTIFVFNTGGKEYGKKTVITSGNTGYIGDTARPPYKNDKTFFFDENVDFETGDIGQETVTTSGNSDNARSHGKMGYRAGKIDYIADGTGNMDENFGKTVTVGANSDDSKSYSVGYHTGKTDSTGNMGENFSKTVSANNTVVTDDNIQSNGIEGSNTGKSESTAGGYKVIYGNGKVIYPGKIGHYTNNVGGAGEQGISGAVTLKG